MSKNVKQIIPVSPETRILMFERAFKVTGALGSVDHNYYPGISYAYIGNCFILQNQDRYIYAKDVNARIGLEFALIANIIKGVSEGHTKIVVIKGIGFSFKLNLEQTKLELRIGVTHPVVVEIPSSITVKIQSPTQITIKGIEKDKVGAFAAKIREMRPPEPYKGKGIRYLNEIIVLKPGKTRK